MDKQIRKSTAILESVIIIIILQFIREVMEYSIKRFVPESSFNNKIITMLAMLMLTGVVVLYAKLRKQKLSIFPERFSKGYIIFTCVTAAVYISTPSNYTEGLHSVILLIYGSIVTPVYEELIFRGYLWNICSKSFLKQLYTYILSVAFFTVWHIGYMIPNIINGDWNAVLWKLAAGVGYGVILGFIRLKTKNCFSTILAHGIINVFMV